MAHGSSSQPGCGGIEVVRVIFLHPAYFFASRLSFQVMGIIGSLIMCPQFAQITFGNHFQPINNA